MSRLSPRFWGALLLLTVALAVPPLEGAEAQDALQPGEAFVTRFSGTTDEGGRAVIDPDGTVGSIVDLRSPGAPLQGAHWINEPQRSAVTAAEVGQVFGIALDDANPPSVYLTATSAFGLHRNPDNTGWMAGMWGPGGGPGTVWKLDAANSGQPEIFAQISLDGRPNSGAALGNIAFDRWNKQLYVSDLETGMIHRLRLSDGADLSHYDHGVTGRANFLDAVTGESGALEPMTFDPATSAQTGDCPSGDFARTPSCWNFADFRRRVWGVGVQRDPASGDVRLFYSVWGSQGFGNADYAAAGDDQRNSVWSVRIGPDGDFDKTSVRREFFLPDFFRSPEAIARAGRSHPVTDIAFPSVAEQPVMVLAERGGVRNLGLAAENAFATPHEARVLRYERDDKGVWQPVGRYDVGFYDRKDEGPPYIRADSSGGAAFGLGYTESWEAAPAKPDAFLWMTGDALCSPKGPCLDPNAKTPTDTSEVHGLMGREASAYEELVPEAAFQPYPAPGPSYPADGPDRSFMIDLDVDEQTPANDATKIGDVAIYEPEAKKPDLKVAKRALSELCKAGDECAFEVVIENVGEVRYDGPLAIRDEADGGAKLVEHAPPDWNCKELFAGTFECSHTALTLMPGEKVSVALTFKVPDWWTQSVYSNCAELKTPDFTTDERSYNNRACDYVPTIEPPAPGAPGEPPYGPDLLVEKFSLDAECDWWGDCRYVVRVTNVGPANYTGPLHLHDEVDQPGSALADWLPQPEWTCAPVGAIAFDCTHDAVTLTPGDYLEVIVAVHAPPLVAGHTHIRNCTWFDWNGAPRDYNPGNEYDCASIPRFPEGHPGAVPYLEVEKKSAPTCARPAPGADWICVYRITVTNIGAAPYFDAVEVDDVAGPLPATLFAYHDTPPWTCVDGGGGNVDCSLPPIPGGLPAGASVKVDLYFQVPGAVVVPNFLGNCGKILWDADGDGIEEEYESCAISLVCDAGSADCPRDLALLKFSTPDPCFLGEPCIFRIFIQNVSDVAFAGPLVFTDIPDFGLGAPTIDPPALGWVCAPAGDNYTCTNPAGLLPGLGIDFGIAIPVPLGYTLPTVKNCARLDIEPPENAIGANDEDCAIAFVPFPDLAPFGGTSCRRGESCDLDVRIDNKGRLPFLGSAGLRGSLSPAVPISSISSATPGLTCSVTGNGTYECRGERLDIKPGSAAEFEVVIDIPSDFAQDEITHVKEMIWPDSKVKDKNAANDRHQSIITIEGPKEPEEEPQEEPEEPEEPEVTPEPPVAEPPSCPAGWTEVDRNKADALRADGWEIKQVTSGGVSIVCGKAPPLPDCVGGRVVRGKCECPAGTAGEKIGPNAYRCVELPPPLICEGGRVSNGECFCPKGTEREKIGPQAYRCVEFPPLICKGGRVSNGECFCPKGTERKQTGPNAYTCVELPPPLICKGGKVVGRECFCPKGTERKQTGPNVYTCVELPPPLTCKGGKVVGRECVCPKGTERKQTGPHAYACVELPPPLTCKGGKVVGRECICPKGTKRKQTGPNAYTCVELAPPLTCKGGKVVGRACVCPKGTERRQTGTYAYTCETPAPPPQCEEGWRKVDSKKAKDLEKQGWEIKKVGTILCARPGQEL